MNMIQALNSALDIKMTEDPNVLSFGEDAGYFGGVFRVTDHLQKKHGLTRSFDAPISECGIVAAAIGMGAYGLRPVVEIQFADYIYPAYDQIVSEAAKLRYRSAGQFTSPITVRSPYGGGIFGGFGVQRSCHRWRRWRCPGYDHDRHWRSNRPWQYDKRCQRHCGQRCQC
jgi:2-oxoisovalerate dehydrogenase E1 component beta subunit